MSEEDTLIIPQPDTLVVRHQQHVAGLISSSHSVERFAIILMMLLALLLLTSGFLLGMLIGLWVA